MTMTAPSEFNLFVVLDLDPEAPWNAADLSRRITVKRSEWAKQLNSPGKKGIAAKRNLELLPTLTKVAASEAASLEHANQAKNLRSSALPLMHEKLNEAVKLLQAKGEVLAREFDRLVSVFSDVCTESEIRVQLGLPVRTNSDVGSPKTNPLERHLARDIDWKLQELGHDTLYDFLGDGFSLGTQVALLQAEAEERFAAALKNPNKDARLTLIQTLAGQARWLFKTAEGKKRYDDTLNEMAFERLMSQATEFTRLANSMKGQRLVQSQKVASGKPVTVYGIDLGATYSCIAVVDEYGKPTVIRNYDGDHITPSVVQFDGPNRIVGKEAKNTAQLYPDTTVEMVKRRMGDPNWRFTYEGVDYRPEEISSYILRKLVSDAEQNTGAKITDVVITCPAYFSINQREATAAAGKIAGLNVRGVINDLTAAVLAYGVEQDKDTVVLVYGLGGSSFSSALISVKSGNIEVIAMTGAQDLGGRDWDDMVVNYLADQWKQEADSQDDPLDDPETLQDLLGKAENAKKALSTKDKTEVAVTYQLKRVKVTLTRSKFDELTRSILERTTMLTEQMLEAARAKGHSRFDRLLLVGGSTRMRQVFEDLQFKFGVEPQILDPDQTVAKGAAIYGMKLALDEGIRVELAGPSGRAVDAVPKDTMRQAELQVASEKGSDLPRFKRLTGEVKNVVEVKNVASHSLGVETVHDSTGKWVVRNLILLGERLPVSITKTFGTLEANQDSVDIRVMKNMSVDATAELDVSVEVCTATLILPPGLPADAPIEFTLTLDTEGVLHVTGRALLGDGVVEGFNDTRLNSKAEMVNPTGRSTRIVL